MIKQSQRIIKKLEFGTEFEYREYNKIGCILVKRIDGEILQTIKFWGGDRLKEFSQFEDACTTWCDQNAA